MLRGLLSGPLAGQFDGHDGPLSGALAGPEGLVDGVPGPVGGAMGSANGRLLGAFQLKLAGALRGGIGGAGCGAPIPPPLIAGRAGAAGCAGCGDVTLGMRVGAFGSKANLQCPQPASTASASRPASPSTTA